MGVKRESLGALPRGPVAGLRIGALLTGKGGAAGSATAFWAGDGGMPRDSFGVLVPDCERPPGRGALSKGTGDDMLNSFYNVLTRSLLE